LKDLARKYRPRSLSDIVGQPVVVQTLSNAIKNNSLHHAHLFVGQFGSGKTSLARILAAMENCSVSPGIKPCGKCEICKKIFNGIHTDVREIDAASSAGSAEDIRKLKTSARYNPVDGCKVKYYILDEIGRASPTAGDALLKLIEEPPAGVKFVLATTEVQKLRPAIQSRCQRHDIRKIYWGEIAERLKVVAKKEKVEVEDTAINICARLAQGSMRNGLQNLEKLSDYVGDSILTGKAADELFGSVDETLLYELFDYLIGLKSSKIDTSSGLQVINKILQTGVEFRIIYQNLVEYLRNMVVMLTASNPFEFIDVSQEGKRRLKEQCIVCQKKQKHKALFHIQSALNEAKQSVDLNMSAEHALQSWYVRSVIVYNDSNL